MTDRIQNLIDAGRLVPQAGSDTEVAGLWSNALEAFADASMPGISTKGRLVLAYDAGRIAVAALVRSRDLRVRATNHHEVTLTVAGFVPDSSLATLLLELDDVRTLRSDAQYGWENNVSAADAENALEIVRRILIEGARNLLEHRPALANRIQPPA